MALNAPSAKKMDEASLKNIVGQKITGSLGFMGGTLSTERLEAERRYKGEAYGDEQVGRSSVVSRDVAESVDSMLPALLKVFTSGDHMVRFDPRKPQDEEVAKQQTEYVNWMWFTKNQGFTVLHDWFKDALLKKLGVVKIYWETGKTSEKETYKGLTDAEFQELESDGDVDVISHEEYDYQSGVPALGRNAIKGAGVPGVAAGGMAPGTPGITPPAPPAPQFHDVIVRRSKNYGCARVVNVPPEEFLIDHRAVTLDEAPFLCHRSKKTLTELKEMGFDEEIVDTLGPDGAEDFNAERVERFKDEDAYPYRDDNYVDPSMREVWINECYMKIDFDGDGYAEMRQITLAGESTYVLLENEEIDDHPFATLTPIPMPHKVYGQSIADQTTDLQRIKTALWRGALDSIYFNITPMVGIVDGQVQLDDLLNRRPGGVVRMKNANAMVPIPSEPLAEEVFTMVEYVDGVREARTGVKRFSSTLDADQINPLAKTATAATLNDNAANDRLSLIARIFAETGIKQAFKRILELICKHGDQKEIIKLRGKFVEFDPREWTSETDISINVGLGTGNRDQQLGRLMGLSPLYQEIVQLQQGLDGPLVTAENLYNFLSKIVEFSDLKFPEMYFSDPKNAPPKPPKPDPKMAEAQAKIQAQQAETQAKMQAAQAQSQADIAEQQIRAKTDIAISQAKMQQDMQLAKLKAELDAQLEREKAAHAMKLEEMRLNHDMRVDGAKLDHERMMGAAKLDHEKQMGTAKLQMDQQATQHKLGMDSQVAGAKADAIKAKAKEKPEPKAEKQTAQPMPTINVHLGGGKKSVKFKKGKDGKIEGAELSEDA